VPPGAGIISAPVSGSVDAVVERLVSLIEARSMKVFAVIDHGEGASRAGLSLRATKVVIFGSPMAGTPVMEASPLTALDLPLKVLIWDDGGTTTISYTDPAVLAARHGLSPELSARLAGIGPLVESLATICGSPVGGGV
jgi:uncharacterized protein (DUF302 family)